MRVRHPAITLALILTLSLLAALALTVCDAPQDEPDLPVSTASPPTALPQTDPSPEPTAASGHSHPGVNGVLPGIPGVSPEAMILVSSGVMSVDEPLTINGSGFIPGEPIMLLLVIDDIIRYVVGGHTSEQPVANAAGAFSASFDSIRGGGGERGALERAPGVRSILAVGADGSRAAAPVMITSAPTLSVASSLVATADTVLNDETGGLDTTITAVGAGFAPREAVTVTTHGLVAGADKVLTGITANDSGTFEVSSTLSGAAPPEGAAPEMPFEPGVYTVLAEGSQGSIATAALVVDDR